MARVEIPLLVAASVVCLLSRPEAAEAARKVCDSLRITSEDEAAMREVVTPLAGQRVIKWSATTYCVMPASAHSWVPLKSESQPDGTVIASNVFCDREPSDWVCNLSQNRSGRVTVTLGGRKKTFDLELPLDLAMAQVEFLLKNAAEVAPTMTIEQQCGYEPQQPPDADVKDWLRSSQDTFRFSYPRLVGTIVEADGFVSLIVDEEVLRFVRNASDATKLEFRCWSFRTTIT